MKLVTIDEDGAFIACFENICLQRLPSAVVIMVVPNKSSFLSINARYASYFESPSTDLYWSRIRNSILLPPMQLEKQIATI